MPAPIRLFRLGAQLFGDQAALVPELSNAHPELDILQSGRKQPMRVPVYEFNPARRMVGDSTKESALARHSSNEGYGSGSREPQTSSQ